MNGVFVTGSNTGVGKTTVAVEMVRKLSEQKIIRVRKPVESDCPVVAGEYAPRDAIALSEACTNSEPLSTVCPFCYEMEASAEKASSATGKTLTLAELVSACHYSVGDDDFVLVEGAGGFYSPIAENVLNADLAVELNLPLVIIVRDELGAISQALLTIEAAVSRNLRVACVVLNQTENNKLSNIEALQAYTKIPLVRFSPLDVNQFWTDINGLV